MPVVRPTIVLPRQSTQVFNRGSTAVAPSAPTAILALAGDTRITVSWAEPAGSILRYKIYFDTVPGVTTADSYTVVYAPATSGVVSGLTNGTTYYLRVAAVGPGGESPLSTEVSSVPSTFLSDRSLLFDGTNEYVTAGDFANWDFGAGDWCLQCWVKRSATGGVQGLICKSNAGTERQFELTIQGTDVIQVLYDTIIGAGGNVSQDTVAAFPTLGVWRHILAQKKAGAFEIWVDGFNQALAALSGVHGTMIATAQSLQFGARNAAANYPGNIDEVSVWNKSFSAVEISSLYNAGKPPGLSVRSDFATNCKGWWRMGEGAVFPSIPDVALAHTGSMINMEAGDIVADAP